MTRAKALALLTVLLTDLLCLVEPDTSVFDYYYDTVILTNSLLGGGYFSCLDRS